MIPRVSESASGFRVEFTPVEAGNLLLYLFCFRIIYSINRVGGLRIIYQSINQSINQSRSVSVAREFSYSLVFILR